MKREEILQAPSVQTVIESAANGVRLALTEAIKEGIRANAVLFNDRFVKIKAWILQTEMTANGQSYWRGAGASFPPMIGGLAAFFTDELPEEIAFVIGHMPGVETYESMKEENERLRKENERLRSLAEFVRDLFDEEEDA